MNNCRQKPDVLSSNHKVKVKVKVKADSICICFVTKHHYRALPWFLLSLFYILLFSIHIVNVNVAKSSTVLDNLRMKKNIYIFFVRVKAVIMYLLFL